jgi:nitroreductase
VSALDELATLIEGRRSNLRIDAVRPLPDALLVRLCELAARAPNHHLTNPFRFAILTGDARARLGDGVAVHVATTGGDERAVAKARTKYLRAPALVAVGCASAHGADEVVRREDRDATAAAVQTLLLAAEAAGLAAYWGTGAAVDAEAAKEACGFAPDVEIVALVYVGWPLERIRPTARPAPSITVVGADGITASAR